MGGAVQPSPLAKRRWLLDLLRLTAALTVVFVVKWNFVSDGGNVPSSRSTLPASFITLAAAVLQA